VTTVIAELALRSQCSACMPKALRWMSVLVFSAATACTASRTAVPPTLPSADALRTWWADGAPRTAEVDLCVSPSGAVTDVRLARTSGDVHYDAAVEQDVRHWSLAAQTTKPCERAKVTYLP
jgi:hypothetical protein